MNYSIIGIDAGATKTEVVLTDGTNSVEFSDYTAINPNVIGLNESLIRLQQIIRKHFKSCPRREVIVSAGISGVSDLKVRNYLKSELKKRTSLEKILIFPDIEITFASVFSGDDKNCGIMIAGTGSVFYYRNSRGVMKRVGGWGRLIGDEGSGYWIGREALRRVCEQSDGRGKKTLLTEVFAAKFRIDKDSLVRKIYRQGFEISKLAPVVFKAAEMGDKVSHEIIKSAAEKLYYHLTPLRNGKYKVALTGSLFSNERLLEKYLRFYVSRYSPQIKLILPEKKPVWGAVRLAKERYNLNGS